MTAPGEYIAGDVLQASDMNPLPAGIIARVSSQTSVLINTTETITLTTPSFTAVAGRLYRITYHEPANSVPAGAGNYCLARIRYTNTSGIVIVQGQRQESGSTQVANTLGLTTITELSAGSIVLVATTQMNTANAWLYRSGQGIGASLEVEDVGLA